MSNNHVRASDDALPAAIELTPAGWREAERLEDLTTPNPRPNWRANRRHLAAVHKEHLRSPESAGALLKALLAVAHMEDGVFTIEAPWEFFDQLAEWDSENREANERGEVDGELTDA